MSGYTVGTMVSRQPLAEEDNFIQKPFSGKELGAKLRQVLAAPPRLQP